MDRRTKKTIATELRHRIWIQSKRDTPDGQGGFSEAWINRSNIWAAIYPIKAAQIFDARSIDAETTHLIKIRGLETRIDDTNRILFGTRIFEIIFIENLQERNFVKVVQCKEKIIAGDDSQTTTEGP